MDINFKLENLKRYLLSLGKVAVAFSSGVDSTFLLKVAHEVLGDNVIALTAKSSSFPRRELDEAINFCRENKIKQIICETDELEIPGFRENPPNRCYICKKAIFQNFLKVAAEQGFEQVCEGSNMDDNGDYRPGLIAVSELKIKSPLREAELYKSEIRALSKEMNLPTWDKPSFACLSTRFVYGEEITKDKLLMIEKAEQFLMDLGCVQFRVRHHGTITRIEVFSEDFELILNNREKIIQAFENYGFTYVALDLKGYRTGSMNININ